MIKHARPSFSTVSINRSQASRCRFSMSIAFLALVGFASLLMALPARAQGPVSVGTNIPPMTRGPSASGATKKDAVAAAASSEEPMLALALATFRAKTAKLGKESAVWQAISEQTKVSSKTLRRQNAESRMTHGELLVANSLAHESGNSFGQIVALRAGARSWSELARKLRVDPALLARRVNAAEASIKKSKGR